MSQAIADGLRYNGSVAMLQCLLGLGTWMMAGMLTWSQAQAQAQATLGSSRDAIEARPESRIVWQKEVTLPGGIDRGQHLATVLEVRSAAGVPLLAAGFVNGGQTSAINDHRSINFFINTGQTRESAVAIARSTRQ